MGDARYAVHLERLLQASDRAAEMARMDDDAIVQALAAASAYAQKDPYLANVLATEAMNRIHRARLVVEHMWEGVLTTDREARVQSMNPSAGRILGRGDLHGRHVRELLCQEEEGCPAVEALRTGRPVVRKAQTIYRADGSSFLASVTAAPVVREDAPEGAVVVFDDVTAEREAESARDAALAKFRAVFRSDRDALVLTDAERVVVDLNEAFTRLTGYSLDEARGDTTRAFFDDPRDYEALEEDLMQARSPGGTPHARLALWRRKDGSRFVAEITPSIVRDESGAVMGHLGVIRDVTAHHEEDRALKDALALLDLVVQNVPVGIAILDGELRFRQVNKYLAGMHDLTPEQMLGRRLGDVLPDLTPMVRDVIRALRQTGRHVTCTRLRISDLPPPNDSAEWNIDWYPLPGGDGSTGTAVIVTRA